MGMNPGEWSVFTLFTVLHAVSLSVYYRIGRRVPVGGWDWFNLGMGLVTAVYWFYLGAAPIGVEVAAYCGWLAWTMWSRRPPRKRRKSKALARIRDLGHRLVVTH